MNSRELYRRFRHDLQRTTNGELGQLVHWLHEDQAFARECGREFVLAADGVAIDRAVAELNAAA